MHVLKIPKSAFLIAEKDYSLKVNNPEIPWQGLSQAPHEVVQKHIWLDRKDT